MSLPLAFLHSLMLTQPSRLLPTLHSAPSVGTSAHCFLAWKQMAESR